MEGPRLRAAMSMSPADLQMANFQIREMENACAINTMRSTQAAAFTRFQWSKLICSGLPVSDCKEKPGSILHDQVARGWAVGDRLSENTTATPGSAEKLGADCYEARNPVSKVS